MVERDLALAAYEEQPLHLHAPLGGASRSPRCAARRTRGVARERRGDAAPPRAHRRGGPLARPEREDEPAAARGARPRRAARRAARRHDRGDRDRPRAARAAREGRAVRGGAVRRHRPRDGVRGALHASSSSPGLLPLETLLERMSAGPARIFGLERPRIAVGRARRTSSCSTSRGTWTVTRGRLPLALGELVAARRARCTGSVAMTVAAGARGARVSGIPRARGRHGLPRASRSAPTGFAFGEAVFTTAMTGYQEVVDRPELRRAARLLHRADGRQLRRRPDALRVDAAARARGADARGARPGSGRTGCTSSGIVALTGIDTRSLVLKLRDAGAMRGVACSGDAAVDEALALRAAADR